MGRLGAILLSLVLLFGSGLEAMSPIPEPCCCGEAQAPCPCGPASCPGGSNPRQNPAPAAPAPQSPRAAETAERRMAREEHPLQGLRPTSTRAIRAARQAFPLRPDPGGPPPRARLKQLCVLRS